MGCDTPQPSGAHAVSSRHLAIANGALLPDASSPFSLARDSRVLSIAGFWDGWKKPEPKETILTCTLIVTAANDLTRPTHDRMPMLLSNVREGLAENLVPLAESTTKNNPRLAPIVPYNPAVSDVGTYLLSFWHLLGLKRRCC